MILSYLFNLIIFSVFVLNIKTLLHVFQLKDYNSYRYIKFFNYKWVLFLCLSTVSFVTLYTNFYLHIFIFVLIVIIFKTSLSKLIKHNKTPLVETEKIKRLFFICLALFLSYCLVPYSYLILTLFFCVLPLFANLINIYDRQKNKQYIQQAQNKLKLFNPKIIAITGSNGKTSIKNILTAMLETKDKTQCTPSSFNTPLGISKFINQELKLTTKFLILEYGARKKGDIKTLCNLFGADIGIISCVNPQHLETFKTIENVKNAKGELSDFLNNKLCVFNLDNQYSSELYNEKHGLKQCISIKNPRANIYAKNIHIIDFKTEFDLIINKTYHHISTPLLGKHNVANILLATAVATELEVDTENIIKVINHLKPTPHRLEYIKTHINILDDSYNCSLESAREALWVLNQLENKKMIVTPGIIEGGKQQYEINYKLGRLCTKSDYCIIIGNTNKKAILDGLKSLNFKGQIFTADNLEIAKSYFSLLSTGDNMLLLNDLPDDYN